MVEHDVTASSNYFKMTKPGGLEKPRFIFFNDFHLYSVEDAYTRAEEFEADGWHVCTYRPIECQRGIWDRWPIVGHRSRGQIELDLRTSCNGNARIEELVREIGNVAMYTEAYAEELLSLQARFAATAGGAL